MEPLSAAALVRHHIATPACPLPEPRPGITWIWAANGVFKRGVTAELDVMIPVGLSWPAPGLAQLAPHARWTQWPGRLPGSLLGSLLENARQATSGGRIARPIEKQYFFAWRRGDVKLVAPLDQAGTPASLRYALPPGVLCDVHSHHEMTAYFSPTDDRDDSGLSVSAVVGTIFSRPEIAVRLNVYGHRWRVPAQLVFDDLGPFTDVFQREQEDRVEAWHAAPGY